MKLHKQNKANLPVRRFGRTDYAMPVFSCGCMRFQHAWNMAEGEVIPQESHDNVDACLKRAFELGINHFETARGYGTSEEQMGRVLPTFNREDIIVQTKIGIFENPQEFRDAFETSLQNLRIPYIDFLSLHGINDEKTFENSMKKGGCLDVAKELVSQGRVRHIGFSTHGWCENISKTIKTGEFDYLNMHWYFVNDLNRQALMDAKEQDMGVLILSPNDKGGKLYNPPAKLRTLCGDIDPMVFNDLFCLSNDAVSTLSQGVSQPSEFDTHMEAIKLYDNRHRISKTIASKIRSEMDSILGTGWCENWHKGIPEFFHIPNNINILEIVRLWAFATSLDMIEFAKMRYNLLGNGGHWFPGKKPLEFDRNKTMPLLENSWIGAERICDIIEDAQKLLAGKEMQRLSKS